MEIFLNYEYASTEGASMLKTYGNSRTPKDYIYGQKE